MRKDDTNSIDPDDQTSAAKAAETVSDQSYESPIETHQS